MPKKELWRDYLQGRYKPRNKNAEQQMRFKIRKYATQWMKDLLLVSEKLPEEDRIMIFQNPRTYSTVMWPALSKLMMQISDIPPSIKELRKVWRSKEVQELIKTLESYGIKYDLVRLVKDESYREMKKVQCTTNRFARNNLDLQA